MPRSCSKPFTLPLLFLAAALFTTASHGIELPTLDELIEATPNIDTSDPETKSFRFTAEFNSPPLHFETTIAWQRDKLVGMRTLLGKDRYPGLLISNQQTRLFDPCKGRMYKLPPSHPQFSIRASEGKATINYGVSENSEEEAPEPIVLDLKSLIRERRDLARLAPDRNGYYVWLVIFPTEENENDEGRGGLMAAYEPRAPHRLICLSLYPVKHQPPALRISNLFYNQTKDVKWPTVPADELLPEDVTIVDSSDFRSDENFTLQQASELYVAHFGFGPVQAGLDYEQLRGHEALVGVDWDKTRRFATEVGPKITPLWR